MRQRALESRFGQGIDEAKQRAAMEKGLTIAAMASAVVIFLLFLSDLVIAIPFRRASLGMDIAFVIASIGLAYISWNTFRDLR